MNAPGIEHESRLGILVVDDNADDRIHYRRLLGRAFDGADGPGADVVEADSGAKGLELLKDSRVDCILLDFRLPDLDGLEFLEQLDRLYGDVHVAVVMLTGQGSESVAVEAMKRGARDYLVKGELSSDSLHKAIHSAVERADIERTLERQRREIERSNRELEQYAHVVAHGLRSPLLSMLTALDLIERGGSVDAEGRQWISGAVEAGTRMRRLIDDILAHSRVTGAQRPRARVECSRVVAVAIDNLRAEIEAARAAVAVQPLPAIVGDETQFIQLFENLIANAIKFRADEPPRISVSAERLNDRWLFAIRDNGIGIASEHADKIFNLFERLHSHEDRPGSGIGLATCKKIVESCGGLIWVESEVGKGATFCFSLPSGPAENPPPSKKSIDAAA